MWESFTILEDNIENGVSRTLTLQFEHMILKIL
jgi:hypothetical protein